MTRPRAVDLYAGVGGWSLGLKMAGVDVVRSFEWWSEAVATHEANFASPVSEVDIRGLSPDSVPKGLDFVVGSPPCTQFSFANRGGNGDISDGLRDIEKFLDIVEAAEPRAWVMENVPRVAAILERELARGGRLRRFRGLITAVTVVDMATFGLPQRRSRMLAGNFPLGLLESYRGRHPVRTLGDVVDALESGDPIVDPIYGVSVPRSHLTENEREPALDPEETRMNRDAKEHHPVYNVMRFPDPRDRTARTVTALCTRVSRESIVIQEGATFRRLTVRERASLQGFPVTFQFFGRTHQSKVKMVGNAFPPAMAYFVAKALMGAPAEDVKDVSDLGYQHPLPAASPPSTPPEAPRRRFPMTRRFRAAVPSLRFGSGTRFELVNYEPGSRQAGWKMRFSFGTSKAFIDVELDGALLRRLRRLPIPDAALTALKAEEEATKAWLGAVHGRDVQAAWAASGDGPHPFEVVDHLGASARKAVEGLISAEDDLIQERVLALLEAEAGVSHASCKKLRRYAREILAGLYVGCWFNRYVRP